MIGYSLMALNDMISELGEGNVKNIHSSFSSPLNPDVEYFIKHKAIEFAKQAIAPTTLVYTSYKGAPVICGYFTITIKSFIVRKKEVGSNTFKRLRKFGTYDEQYKCSDIPAPLIAQLSKNYNNGYNSLISGKDLPDLALSEVKRLQAIGGGKIVYIECEDKPRLKEFYHNNGFGEFGKRNLDRDERDKLSGQYLIQMLKYLN